MPPKYFLAGNVGLMERTYRRLARKQEATPSFPKAIQIQTKAGCNARCVFCPNLKTHLKVPPLPMDPALYKRIIDEALEHDVERLSPYLMNEPLADPDLPERIAYISNHPRKTPRTVTKINSNGSPLTEDMAKRLLDSGLERVSFSVHGIQPGPYESTMVGLKLHRVLANIDRFLERKREGGYKNPRVRVTMIRTTVLEPQLPAIQAYWGARGVKVNIRALENRSHDAIKPRRDLVVSRWAPFAWCDRMFEQAYILNSGKLVLCCVDWEQKTDMGDLNTHTLYEIWNGPAYRKFRERFLANDLAGMLCDGCAKDDIEEE